MLRELFSSTKRIVIKIIPHHAESIYKLEISHRHVAILVAGAVIFGSALVTFQVGAVRAASAQMHSLQMADAQHRAQLITFSRQTHDMMRRLKQLQRDQGEIRKLTGIVSPEKKLGDVRRRSAQPALSASRSDGPISLWSRVRSLLRGGRVGGDVTFASESTELATLDIQLNGTLAVSRTLEAKAEAAAQAKRDASQAHQRFLNAIPSMWPTDGYVSSGFGYRTYPDSEFHPGLDIVNDYGASVYATAAGVVESSGWDGGYGYKIVIDHGNGYETWYGHNSRLLVVAGDTVRKGEEIAEVGSTGYATGPHCHYEILLWGRPVDPTPYLDGVPAQLVSAR